MSGTSAAVDRPRLHPAAWLGPELRRGARSFHVLKDRRTGRCFELGTKEYFIVSRLDGLESTEEIGARYAGRFGRRLDRAAWNRIIGMLWQRGLLDGSPPPTVAEAPAARAATRRRVMSGQALFGDPTKLLNRIAPFTRALFTPVCLAVIALLSLAMLVLPVAHLGTLITSARAITSAPVVLLISLVPIWLGFAVHEFCHALAAHRFGGTADEIGMRWRLPVIYFYCNAADVRLLTPARRRVAVAVAGVAGTLIFAAPFYAGYLAAAPGTEPRAATALVVLCSVSQAWLNLLPFPDLDGYRIISHATARVNLAEESFRYVRRRGARRAADAASGAGAATDPYSRADRIVYSAYVLGFTAVLGLCCGGVILLDQRMPAGPGRSAAEALAVLVALGILLGHALPRERLRQRRGADSPTKV